MKLILVSPPPLRRPRRAHGLLGLSIVLLALTAALSQTAGATGFSAAGRLPQLGSGRIWQVAAEPSAPNTVLAGTDHGLYLSKDAGATWAQTSFNATRVWAVGFDARNPTLSFAGTSGQGVIFSQDGGQTWQDSSAGLLNRVVRSLAFGLDGIAAGTDAGVFLSPDGHAWHDVGLDGDAISAVAIAANTPAMTIVAGADAGQLSGGYLFRSTAGGTWQALLSGLPSQAVVSGLSAGPIDQAVPQRPLVAATSKGLVRSGDGGTTWTPSAGLPAAPVTITTATFSPLDPDLVYAGSDGGGSSGGGLFRSIDSGVTFTPADAGLPQNTKNAESIAVASTNPPTVVAAIDAPSGASVYTEIDTTAPAPPQLVAESPGQPIPAVISTPKPTPRATPAPVRSAPAAAGASGLDGFVGTVFHWPIPLIYELIFALLIAYLFVRWRQHYYVEGPP